ncbi:MAG: hypothetical protein AAGK92_11890 [Pseudomonadota bacterium]
MNVDALIRAIGPRVAHCTASENIRSIGIHGLQSAADLATRLQHPASTIALRNDRLRLVQDGQTARLNHQRPILYGLEAANRIVEGHDAQSWAEQLDRRIFFWPERRGKAFMASVERDLATTIIWLDTRGLIERYANHLWLSPINSGNFTQGGAHAIRGDWLYVPVTAGIEAFRENRRKRGLKGTKDSIVEISLTCPLPAAELKALQHDP